MKIPQNHHTRLDAFDLFSGVIRMFSLLLPSLFASISPNSAATSLYHYPLQVKENADTLGINFDPSHLIWQNIEPSILIRDFPDRIYHVHWSRLKKR